MHSYFSVKKKEVKTEKKINKSQQQHNCPAKMPTVPGMKVQDLLAVSCLVSSLRPGTMGVAE